MCWKSDWKIDQKYLSSLLLLFLLPFSVLKPLSVFYIILSRETRTMVMGLRKTLGSLALPLSI